MSKLVVWGLTTAMAVWVFPVLGQQQGPNPYDMSKKITLTGTVEEFDWGKGGDPTTLMHIHLAVKGKNGQVEHWIVEAEPPVLALKDGWTPDMIKPGDEVKYEVSPAIKGGFLARGGTRIIVNGKEMGSLIHPDTVTIPAVHVN